MLVLLPNWLGDVAMCTPALRALRTQYPNARITVAGRAPACELLAGLPYFDAAVAIPHRPGFLQMLGIARRLRPCARELAVVFPHSFRLALLAWLTGARRRVGYARGGRSHLLTERMPRHLENGAPAPVYTAREYLELVAALGCADDNAGLALAADAEEVARVRQGLPEQAPVAGVVPGAAFGPSKRWLAARFAAVADALHERTGAACLLITGPGEEDVRDEVRAHARHPLIDPQADGADIARLKAAVAAVDVLVTNDTGPRHIAVAFGKPVVCIMGPTSPKYTASPWERGEVLRVDVDCGPCQKPVCTTDHRCMTRIAPETVVQAVMRWLPARP